MEVVELEINVTQKDIQNGDRCIASSCPIALAFKRKLKPTAGMVYVGASSASINGRKGNYLYTLPVNAISFIQKFDSSGKGRPFSFAISLPKQLIRQNSLKKAANATKNRVL